jgi:hypothetical protein
LDAAFCCTSSAWWWSPQAECQPSGRLRQLAGSGWTLWSVVDQFMIQVPAASDPNQRASMRNKRFLFTLVAIAITGFVTPWLVPQAWLSYILATCIVLGLVWGVLAANSARGGELGPGLGALSWLVLGTERPAAEVADRRALALFWITVLYAVSFCVGAFAAVLA